MPMFLLTGCQPATPQEPVDPDDPVTPEEPIYPTLDGFTKIEKQYQLTYDYTFSYYSRKRVNVWNSQEAIRNSKFYKGVYEMHFAKILEVNPFDEYDEDFFKSNVLVCGTADLYIGAEIWFNKIEANQTIESEEVDGVEQTKDAYHRMLIDEVYQTKPAANTKTRTILYMFPMAFPNESFPDLSAQEAPGFFNVSDGVGGATNYHRIQYWKWTIFLDEFNKDDEDSEGEGEGETTNSVAPLTF